MKAEINNENKAKFFAHYWGQKVLADLGFNVSPVLQKMNKGSFPYERDFGDYHLSLTPLSKIANEDAIEVGKIVWEKYPSDNDLTKIFQSASLGSLLKDLTKTPLNYSKSVFINDYLRSKGYALPWMGLSVEEMVDAGWIVLK